MALRAVPEHPKFHAFKAKAGLTKGAALGYLECVWHFTARFAPAGDIGKFSPAAVEKWCEWDGKPGLLIRSLLASGWLDRANVQCAQLKGNLVVHDWKEHCDDAVKISLARSTARFADGSVPSLRRLSTKERAKLLAAYEKPPNLNRTVRTKCAPPVPVPVPVPDPRPVPVPDPNPPDSKRPHSTAVRKPPPEVSLSASPSGPDPVPGLTARMSMNGHHGAKTRLAAMKHAVEERKTRREMSTAEFEAWFCQNFPEEAALIGEGQ